MPTRIPRRRTPASTWSGSARPSRTRRTSRSGSRRSSRSSTPRRSSSSTASRSCSRPRQADEVLRRVGARRADRHRDRDPLGARARPSPRPPSASASAASALFALAESTGLALAATGTHPWANYLDQQIIDTDALPAACARTCGWVAQRNNTWSLHVHVGVRGADRAIAVCDWLRELLPPLLAALGQLAVPRRPRHRPAQRPHRDLHPHLPALRRPRAVRRLGDVRGLRRAAGRDRDRSSRRPSSGGACARTTPSARSRSGSATPRPAATSRSTLAGADRRLRRARPRSTIDEHGYDGAGRRRRCAEPRQIEENLWRAIRYGMDGEMIDFRERARGPDPRRSSRDLVEWTAPARARGSASTLVAARAQRRPARARGSPTARPIERDLPRRRRARPRATYAPS